jgi:AcrR family transcriptional regulator
MEDKHPVGQDINLQSRRELKKADKLQRIKEASLALFLTKGYDDTTTREIAKIAGVALGTIFVYAENKRDLLFLIYNDDLEQVVEQAEAAVSPTGSFLSNMLTIASLHLTHYGRRPEISRYALREMYFYDSGVQSRRFHAIRNRLLRMFVGVVEVDLAAGNISSSESAGVIGNMVFALFQFEIRRFLMGEKPDLEAAVQSFRSQITVLLTGLKPTDEAYALGAKGRQKKRTSRIAGKKP